MNSNILLGRFLAELYKTWPSFDWYPAYLLLMVFISGTIIIFAALRLRFDVMSLLLCAGFLVVVESFYVLDISFTTTASMVGISAAALIVSLLFKPPGTRAGLVKFGSAIVILFVLCALLREKSFFLIGGLTFIGTVIVWTFNHDKRRTLFCLIVGVMSFGFGSAFIAYDRHSYKSDQAMHEFITQKKIKSRFVEYGQIAFTEKNRHVFEACAVSENDFMMMRYWFYDTRIENFSVEKIQCLADGFPKHKQSVKLGEIAKTTFGIYKRHIPILVFVLALGILGARSPPKTVLVLCVYVVPALVFAYIYIFYKAAPLRLSTPVFGFFAALILVAHMAPVVQKIRERKHLNLVINSLAAILIFWTVVTQVNKRVKVAKFIEIRQNKLRTYVADLSPQNKDVFLVWSGGSFPIHWASPFGDVRQLFANYHQVGVGTSYNSPLSREQLKRFGLNNPYLDIIDNEHVKFIFAERTAGRNFKIYKEFVKINYELDVCFVVDNKIDRIIVGSVKTGNHCQVKLLKKL